MATDVDIERLTYLEIRDRLSREVVTVIEVLSPTNKPPGPDREQYLTKRRGVLHSPAHFVEIDLLRGFPKMPAKEMIDCDFSVMVSVAEERPGAGFWPIGLRERLPSIPIPLREPVAIVRIDLQAIVDQVYDRAYYKDYIYRGTREPPLRVDDQERADALIPRETPNSGPARDN